MSGKKQLAPLSCLIELTPEPKRARDSESTRENLARPASNRLPKKSVRGNAAIRRQTTVDLRGSPRYAGTPITRSFTEAR